MQTEPDERAERQSREEAAEQTHLDLAHASLEAMRARASLALEQARHDAKLSQSRDDSAAIEYALMMRLQNLAESRAALCFGRIDEETIAGRPGDKWHIGRRHVEGPDGEPVVLDWRVPVAVPFYRATWADPQGLALRRRLAVDNKVVAGLFDEDFSDPDGVDEGGGVPDPLLAELERSRSGEMRDIVATIQAEQDVIIRAGLNDLVIVQGGPGTGKTAVGLHRAAFLLYEHRKDLEKQGLLVVGPNELFLRYIAQVLPSLGERSVTQTTVEKVYGLGIARATEDPAIAKLKGDQRMAAVIRNAVLGSITPLSEDVVIPNNFAIITLPAEQVNEVLRSVRQRDLATNDAREVFRAQMMAVCWRNYLTRSSANEGHNESFHRDLKTRNEFKKLIDNIWPAFTAVALVRALLSSPAMLSRAADGVLTPAEQQLLKRKKAATPKDERWTRADLALLDEAQALVAGLVRTYGHVVVDEAQDLSDMELRMVGRRTPNRSMTILGDLAQATSIGAQTSWESAMEHLTGGSDRNGQVAELTLGYRVPASILEVANELLPTAAPNVTPSRSVRSAGRVPTVVALDQLLTEVNRLRREWATVAVIAPEAEMDEVLQTLSEHGPADARSGHALEEGVTVLGAVASKGLEFDAVVVVNRVGIIAEFGGDEPRGSRALYVALTRAVQELVLVD
jgi:DNA helicase IV